MAQSVGTDGDAFDNAMVESCLARTQTQLLNTRTWKTPVELSSAIFDWIEGFYNRTSSRQPGDDVAPRVRGTTLTSNHCGLTPTGRAQGLGVWINRTAEWGYPRAPARPLAFAGTLFTSRGADSCSVELGKGEPHQLHAAHTQQGFINLLQHRVHPTGLMRTGTPVQNPRHSALGNHHPPSAPSP